MMLYWSSRYTGLVGYVQTPLDTTNAVEDLFKTMPDRVGSLVDSRFYFEPSIYPPYQDTPLPDVQ